MKNPLTPDEYSTLLEAASGQTLRHEFTVYLLGYTGMRRREAAAFTPEWLDTGKNRVAVPGGLGKPEANDRLIPLQSDAADELMSYLQGLEDDAFEVTPTTINRRVASVGESADITRVTPRLLRKTFERSLRQLGVPPEVMADILGVQTRSVLPIKEYIDSDYDGSDFDEYGELY